MALMAQILFKRGSVTYYGNVSYEFNLPFLFQITLRFLGTGVRMTYFEIDCRVKTGSH